MSALRVVLAFLGGGLVGLAYFGILWAVVRRIPGARNPALLAAGSFLGRMSLVAAGLVLLMDGSWIRLVAALAGIVTARGLLVRRARAGMPRGEMEASWS